MADVLADEDASTVRSDPVGLGRVQPFGRADEQDLAAELAQPPNVVDDVFVDDVVAVVMGEDAQRVAGAGRDRPLDVEQDLGLVTAHGPPGRVGNDEQPEHAELGRVNQGAAEAHG